MVGVAAIWAKEIAKHLRTEDCDIDTPVKPAKTRQPSTLFD